MDMENLYGFQRPWNPNPSDLKICWQFNVAIHQYSISMSFKVCYPHPRPPHCYQALGHGWAQLCHAKCLCVASLFLVELPNVTHLNRLFSWECWNHDVFAIKCRGRSTAVFSTNSIGTPQRPGVPHGFCWLISVKPGWNYDKTSIFCVALSRLSLKNMWQNQGQ